MYVNKYIGSPYTSQLFEDAKFKSTLTVSAVKIKQGTIEKKLVLYFYHNGI